MKWLLLALLVPMRALGCDVALVLGVDVSHSIDNNEYGFQIAGMVEALDDPVIAYTLIATNAAVSVVQWSGEGEQDVSIPWVRVTSPHAVRALQVQMRTMGRPWSKSNTAVGDALSTMIALFDEVPGCARRVIDFSGDGVNNAGPLPIDARGEALRQGVTINGLAIDRVGLSVTQYYKGHVLTGRGAFTFSSRAWPSSGTGAARTRSPPRACRRCRA